MATISRELRREIERKAARPMRTTAKAERIAKNAVIEASKLHLSFFDEVVKLLPDDLPETFQLSAKEIESRIYEDELNAIVSHDCDCGFHIEQKQYSPSELDDINEALNRAAGAPLNNAIDNAAATWLAKLFGFDSRVTNNTVMKAAYWDIILDTYKWSHQELRKNWQRNAKRSKRWAKDNPFSFVLTTEIDTNKAFIQELYTNGGTLIKDKLYKGFVPDVKKFIARELNAGKSWSEVARSLKTEYKTRDLWHWQRLVRTEMAGATHQTTIDNAVSQGLVYALWSAAAGRCPICDEIATSGGGWSMNSINGYYKAPDIPNNPGDTHPNCRCVAIFQTRVPKSILEYFGDI